MTMLFELPSFKHVTGKSVPEVLSLLNQYGAKAKIIAGGTDLLGLMKDRVAGPMLAIPEVLVNIKKLPQADRITYEEEMGLQIGAAVTLDQLGKNEIVKQKYVILSQAARQVGTTPLRNMGTIGGNICQRPRCLYFRHPFFVCFKKGGSQCYAVTGEHRDHSAILKTGKCIMAHPSDMAPPLIALRAKAIIAGSGRERELNLSEFFLGPNEINETVLQPGEFIRAFQVPKQNSRNLQHFIKFRIRKSSDFAIASVSVVANVVNEICRDAKIVLGGVAPFPYMADAAAEIVRGKRLNEEVISRAAEASMAEARPLPMNRYKVDLTKVLVKRVLMSIADQASVA